MALRAENHPMTDIRAAERPFVERWNPYLKFVVTTKELARWYMEYGASAFYNGALWEPKCRKLPGVRGMVEVEFMEASK